MAKPIIPDVPTFRFNGKRRSTAFNEGVYSLRRLIAKLHDDETGSFHPSDVVCAEKLAPCLAKAIELGGDFSDGFLAALANWLAIGRHSTQPIDTWEPLSSQPEHREIGALDYYEPGPHTLLFDVDGIPVTVSEDLRCLEFGKLECDDFDLDRVRSHGKPISRRKFDTLRNNLPSLDDEAMIVEPGNAQLRRKA